MANSDKNIVIQPSIGSTLDQPSITFTGAGNSSITLKVLDDAEGTLSFEGYEGQVFAINNNLSSGVIYSVNDISGFPIIDADASGNVRLSVYSGNVGVGTTLATAKLDVNGTLNVTGVSTFTGTIDANGGATIDNIQIGVTADNEIDTSTGNLTIDSAGGTTTIDDALTVTGDIDANGVVHITDLGSGGALRIGEGNDLQIYHDEGSNNTFIREVGSGSLKVQATDFHIESTSADNMIVCDADGSVDLYYNTSKKFETASDGIKVVGIVTASSGIVTYYGDGSNLTGISAGTPEVDTTVSTTSATGVGSFATATYRSADVIAQITQGSDYQVGRYLMIHDGTTVTVVEESSVATGSMLGSFDGAINGSNAELRVTLVSAGTAATVTTKIDTVTI